MKKFIKTFALLLIGLAHCLAEESAHTAWQWQQSVIVESPGLYRIDLPKDTLNASSESLNDIRMISPDGIETPYFIDQTKQPQPAQQAAANFKSTIIGNTTVLTARTQTDQALSAITLQTPSEDFIKPAKVEIRKPGKEWRTTNENEVIFRHQNGIGRLCIPVVQDSFVEIRVTINDQRSAPIPFTGIQLTIKGIELETIDHLGQLNNREDKNKGTRFEVDLGARNMHIASLSLDVADPVFSRHYSLYYWDKSNPKQIRKKVVSSGSIYSVKIDQKASTKQLTLPIHRVIPSATLTLEIQNGDNPPLGIQPTIKIHAHPTKLVFHATQSGTWKLITGYKDAPTPRYDLASVAGYLSTPTETLAPSAIQKNPDYKKPPALPNINPAGADIDLSHWAYRRPIEAPPNGLIQIFLDPPTLALSQSKLADIRVIQNGKQLPFLIDRSHQIHTIDTTFETTLDSPQPNTSAYKIKQPHDQLPVDKLIITSDTPVFDRTLSILVDMQDSYGNTRRSYVKHQQWVKTTNNPASQSLSIDLSGYRMPEAFIIEAPNGDNPPISITSVKLVTAKPSVTFKRLSADPVFLYYGNPSANAPNYDLSLIRHELEHLEKQAGTAGAKEVIIPQPTPKGILSTGSPWLWAALGLVVVTLLVVVSKLLPKLPEESASE